MVWNRIKRFLFGGNNPLPAHGQQPADVPQVNWLEAEDNPWGIRVLDVRPVTLSMLSVSRDPQAASNAVSYGNDDGLSFVGEDPPVSRVCAASLRFPVDRLLADGVVFVPEAMEQKWAIFFHQGRFIFVRSWLRKVQLVAEVQQNGEQVEITQVRGTFTADDEDPQLTVQLLDYLLRSHGLGVVYPVPLPDGMEEDPSAAALWCMSMFGDRALVATPHALEGHEPESPLRTHSVLHIAVARAQLEAIDEHLSAGIPVDLLAGDGLAPLHWALAADDLAVMIRLLDRGSPVDVRSSEGATPLMTAVQGAGIEKVKLLLDRGADVNASDDRGFTSLHRAAETGQLDVLQLLLDRGADPDPQAEGHTPRSLAEKTGNTEIVGVLNDRIASE